MFVFPCHLSLVTVVVVSADGSAPRGGAGPGPPVACSTHRRNRYPDRRVERSYSREPPALTTDSLTSRPVTEPRRVRSPSDHLAALTGASWDAGNWNTAPSPHGTSRSPDASELLKNAEPIFYSSSAACTSRRKLHKSGARRVRTAAASRSQRRSRCLQRHLSLSLSPSHTLSLYHVRALFLHIDPCSVRASR